MSLLIILEYIIIFSLGTDITATKIDDAGNVLAETLRHYMSEMQVVDGLQAMGYSTADIPALVKGTLPQVCTCMQLRLQPTDNVSICIMQ